MIERMSQTTRLLIASALAALIIAVWKFVYVDPTVSQMQQQQMIQQAQNPEQKVAHQSDDWVDRAQALEEGKARLHFTNNKLDGTINLVGARLDDLVLKQYKTSLAEGSPSVALLSPPRTQQSYFVDFGWINGGDFAVQLPDSNTRWYADNNTLTPGSSINLKHTNNQGVTFKINISLDHHYMFSIKQYVENKSSHKLELGNYATISRVKSESIDDNMLIHEGAIGVFDDTLKELSYDDLADKGKVVMPNVGWLGFSDKYWLTTLMPSASSEVISKFSVTSKNGINRYQASINSKDSQVISPGENGQWSIIYLFSGAKELELLDLYEKDLDIKLFDRAVDFGVLYFITKPIFELLHQLYDWVGNFGFAILLLTVLIKMLLFPLAHKGFKGMNRLKALQPKMMELKEKLSDKPQEFQKAMIDLYRKEKVNPMGGCLPIVLQIPIFFALYKVLYVTIEMRHAPFIWWIGDLSAPEGISIFNLFGLLSFGVPQFLMIGVFPILMALTMVIQQRLNPQPTDPIQAQVMRLLPLIFLFMFASFPSGLVIYWTWSNILSIAQQLLIKYLEKPKK